MRKPIRGDVIVFHAPRNYDIEYIKRIIGLPGDTVMVSGQRVYVNGEEINEPYISDFTTLQFGWYVQEGVPFTVPEDHFFVMGDNRPRSSDSREFGPITYESIVGQVFYRYFPFEKMGTVANPFADRLQSLNLSFIVMK